MDTIGDGKSNLRFFTLWVLLAQGLGLVAVILVAVWMGHYQGGFAWSDDPAKQFNYHPLFMTLGMIFLFGDAILVYRVFRNEKKIYVKILHAVLQVLALIFASVGLKAVWDSHNLHDPPLNNLYSLHSWIGLTAVTLFALQWVFGFITFLFPGLRHTIRSYYMSIHVFWGVAIFVLAIAAALTGITEKALFALPNKYSTFVPEGYLINCFGLVLVALGLTVVYIVTHSGYKRQQMSDEEHLQLVQ